MNPALTICACILSLGAAALMIGVGFYWFAQGWWVLEGDVPHGGGDDDGDYLERERKRYRS